MRNNPFQIQTITLILISAVFSQTSHGSDIVGGFQSFFSDLRYSIEGQFGAYYYSPYSSSEIDKSGFQIGSSMRGQKHFNFGNLGMGLGFGFYRMSGANQSNIKSQEITQISPMWAIFYSYDLTQELTLGFSLNQYIGLGTMQNYRQPKQFAWVVAASPYAQYNFKSAGRHFYAKVVFEQGLNIAGSNARVYALGVGMYFGSDHQGNPSVQPISATTKERAVASVRAPECPFVRNKISEKANKKTTRKRSSHHRRSGSSPCQLICPPTDLPCQIFCHKNYVDFREEVNSCNP